MEEDRFRTLETFEDGGRRVVDFVRGAQVTICPFTYDGSPCACPTDPMWAMGCPDNYKQCSRYLELIKQNKK